MLRWFKWLPDKQAGRLVTDAWALLYSNIWAVVAIYLAKDAAAFLLHRLAHRLTNHRESNCMPSPACLKLQHTLQHWHVATVTLSAVPGFFLSLHYSSDNFSCHSSILCSVRHV